MTPHLIRPFSSRELDLLHGGGSVRVLAVLGGPSRGYSLQVHLPTLSQHVVELPRHVDTVVFIDDPLPDGSLASVIDDMLLEFPFHEVDVLSRVAAVTEAVKRVDGRMVQEGVDRSSLVSIRPPEVIRREVVAEAVARAGDALWVNPTEFAVSHGASVALFGLAQAGISVPAAG